jgi:hypothetical protein
MIDTATEQLIPLTHAPQAVPHRPHLSTARRWARQGVGGVVLETVMIGGRRFTSREALQRFVHRLSVPRP